ncbi:MULTISPECIES: type I-C CRISPR-associated protein Cas7/Csd2 [Methylobacterium]|jgi:CRISPR-associated protein Csd2|uniref:type I-C CRISPR-associated protein Cas7/Csd2 n=1 Tax=Methylobacterium TaxID=407 RepID=UPI0008E1FC82|nr:MULTISPECIES: type I-C CRISPR-associated protein Cas7/Csd2 [Methylobacterium]MBZ6414170.1 type I-C CRISPR-associated protein Cas7/Csd2 [Methylobacterium sp.]MBK3397189.1 type I-C CRISPR-associated protein Cas7/Csd2 [Methylobacterium ajmalii]MBK3411731.1 type I-C CRISPR-associated protein Cas7/Csd2 [Methylobacterium ajmalii]MBK3423028.1 type I-C CRISPR-associated protein Cas7/Csd2 [Methylobacterium ajmalii]SFF53538.1 CRISPR-associated protein Csd2 [Methylobacterium sp. yr596]
MTSEVAGVTRRHEFVLFFDVQNGNPNGDPDAGNLPRLDPETNQGLVSDVALKRKIRNYVALARPEAPGHEIYMRDGATLNAEHRRAWAAVMPEAKPEDQKKLPKEAKARELTRWMCANFWDIRTFGAVMTTGVNAGQVRGPVQLAFARSVEPVLPLEIAITRLAATTEADAEAKGGRTMGRKHIVPYGLYRAHGFVSAPLASHPVKGTGFSDDDLALLFEALGQMFDHDRSAARGEMATRKLVIFRHATALGNAPAHALFDRVRTLRVHKGEAHEIGADATDNWPPARSFADYRVTVDRDRLPEGVEVIER